MINMRDNYKVADVLGIHDEGVSIDFNRRGLVLELADRPAGGLKNLWRDG
jgi:hypothetical protein